MVSQSARLISSVHLLNLSYLFSLSLYATYLNSPPALFAHEPTSFVYKLEESKKEFHSSLSAS